MSLPNYLAKIKSSGIYRFVWDKSQVTATEAETLRLVVGYSEKGPFNTPVYIDNPGDFKTTFGDVNKKLEKRGVFFHRMALQALAGGPILALNIKKFGNEQVEYVGGNVGAAFDNPAKAAVEKVFNTSRFWTLDPDGLPNNLGTEYGKYITITSTDSKDSSNTIFMRGYTPSGYDVTIKSWYSSSTDEEMPAYMEGYEDMLLSDFFAEIFVFKGKFTPALAKTEELKKYFDAVDGKVTLKPYLVNAFGEKVDTLTALSENECSNFIQRYQGILIPYFKNINGAYISLDLLFNADNDLHKMMMKLNSDFLDDGGYYASATATDLTPFTMKDITTRGYDKLTVDDIANAIKVATDDPTKPYSERIAGITSRVDFMSNTAIIPHVVVGSYGTAWSFVGDDYVTTPDLYVYNAKTAVTAEGGIFTLGAEFKDAGLAEGDRILVKVGNDVKLVTISEVIVGDNNVKIATTDENATPIVIEDEDENTTTVIVKATHILTEDIATMSPLYLEGYTKENEKPANSTVEAKLKWQKTYILDAINTDSSKGYPGLVEALTNRKDIDYRYIVDTFESFIDAELKASLALLAKKKDNAVLLTNFPAIQTFIKSTACKFTDKNGAFQMKYVKEGGNRQKGAAFFSLPSIDNGASWCSFNTPVVFSDGVVKTTVPAAALVSNNFMAKYSGRQPYYIVAGPNYGRLSYPGMVGPDYNFSRADLDILEPMGVNATVFVLRKGTFINSNQTAKQTPVSALSKLNVRELVIYLQDQIEDLLQNYQWEFNTQPLRDLVKAKADTICQNVKANGGIYDFNNQCNEKNNNDDVINNEMFVLSTSIEPGMGCGKMVQELTIYKKGGMRVVIY